MVLACPTSKHRSWWTRLATVLATSLATGVVLSGALAPAARAQTAAAFMDLGDHISAPTGFADYCRRTSECVASRSLQPATVVTLDHDKRKLVEAINRGVNSEIVATSDQDVYGVAELWTDPLANAAPRGFVRGDCEDFALAKRDRLLKAGWPPEAMFLAVAYHPRLGLHAVLVVRTSEGDLVLDSRSPYVDLWSTTAYVWVERQVNATSVDWVRPYRDAIPERALAQLRADDATAWTAPG